MTDKQDEVRPLGSEDIKQMRPVDEVLPEFFKEIVAEQKRQGRGPQRAPLKERITIRLDSDVVSALRSQGTGWQTRLNETLRYVVLKDGAK